MSNKKMNGSKRFIAGATAGACEIIATMPLDVIKTQMQINPNKFRNPIHAATEIRKQGGTRALYYGMPAFLTQTAGKAAIRFTVYDSVKQFISTKLLSSNSSPMFINLLSGMVAGTCESIFWTTPTERLKVLRQNEIGVLNSRFNSMSSIARILVTEQGFTSLYRGIVPTSLRQASAVGFRFMFYDDVKSVLSLTLTNSHLVSFLSGGIVGAISVVLNNPFDAIKSVQQSGKDISPITGQRLGFFGIGSKIYNESGLIGFTRGLSARVPRVFCGQAVTFLVYEEISKLLLSFN